MPERSQGEQPEAFDEKRYNNLEQRVRKGADALLPEEREQLRRFGYYWLDVEHNGYEAMNTFEALQDFDGLKKTADFYLREYSDSHDLPTVLTMLEDYEGVRELLNQGVKAIDLEYGTAFSPLNKDLEAYRQKFFQENETPVATGGVNQGVDLIAIRNLARQYDIAVPIARGGLNQGAIAHLWGMQTRIADIAAHNRKVARGHWVSPVAPEDFAGKRVLLFDKDAVSGASIRHAVKMLSRFKPAEIGVYFLHRVLEPGEISIGTITAGLPKGVKVFSPHNAPLENAGDAYMEAHEKLGTLYGRRRLIERQFTEEAERLKGEYPELANSMRAVVERSLQTFDALNPFLPGVDELREQILIRLKKIFSEHVNYLKNRLYDLPGTAERVSRLIDTTTSLPGDFENEIIKARYLEKAENIARVYEVDNPHYPSNPLAAFAAARAAVKDGYKVALIVGPEGFAYEPYFNDMGIWTIAVNIPESREGEPRTIKMFSDLFLLKGRKVLIVEDDVHTGATLQKLLEEIKQEKPAELGLYLGQPETFQKIANIPPELKDRYIAGTGISSGDASKDFQKFLESKGLKLFKNTK